MCVPWESNPQPLTQCSTTEPHRNMWNMCSCVFTQCHSVSSKLVNCKQTQLIKSQQQHMKDVSETLDWNLWPGAERLHRMCFWDTGSESMIRTQHFLSTHQICNLIFFPLSSTVLILKSTPSTRRNKMYDQSYCVFKLYSASKVHRSNTSLKLFIFNGTHTGRVCLCLNIPMFMIINS